MASMSWKTLTCALCWPLKRSARELWAILSARLTLSHRVPRNWETFKKTFRFRKILWKFRWKKKTLQKPIVNRTYYETIELGFLKKFGNFGFLRRKNSFEWQKVTFLVNCQKICQIVKCSAWHCLQLFVSMTFPGNVKKSYFRVFESFHVKKLHFLDVSQKIPHRPKVASGDWPIFMSYCVFPTNA